MTRASVRQKELKDELHCALHTILVLNQTLREPGVHDGQRADLQKSRGIAITRARAALEELHRLR